MPGFTYSTSGVASGGFQNAFAGGTYDAYLVKFSSCAPTAVTEYSNADMISLYPNPFSTQTVLQTDILLKNATFTVDNCFGQTVAQMKNINGQTIVFNRDNLASGLYFVRLTEENKIIAVDKLVITDR